MDSSNMMVCLAQHPVFSSMRNANLAGLYPPKVVEECFYFVLPICFYYVLLFPLVILFVLCEALSNI